VANYCDFIAVNREYVPIFSAEEDANYPRKWEQFIPHLSLRRIFEAFVPALERTSAASKKPIWISGSYGTGKTYAAFLIKHLLEDDLALVQEYFLRFKDSPFIKGFDDRIIALRRNGPYLVVYRSGSSHLRSSRTLLMEVQRAIAEALRKRGMNWRTQTVADTICTRITDPESTFNWGQAFEKHRERFDGTYENASQVIERIQEGAPLALLDDIAEVLEAEGFSTFSSAEEVKNWIEEVIRENGLAGIVFLSDEMTNFFTGQAPVDILQELAHASARMPFYLYLITHRSPEQLGLPDSTWRVLHDRFHHVKFEMANQTAYELMQSALKPIPATHKSWENRKDQLWDKVRYIIPSIRSQDSELKDRDAKNLLPLHPYSAYLVTTISRYMSSAQRTLFQFIQTDTPGSFVDFCQNNPSGSLPNHFLTADYLWDYFFRTKNDELPRKAHQAIDYYQNIEEHLKTDEERRAAKVTLLLYALHHQISGVKLLRPSRDNLSLAFYGTHMGEQIHTVMENLCSRKVFHRTGLAGSEEYTITLVGIDQEELDKIIADTKRIYSLSHLASKSQALGKALDELFSVSQLSRRQKLICLSADDLLKNGERVFQRDSELAPYQIKTVIVVAKDETERQLCNEKINMLRDNTHLDRLIFILLGIPFTEDHRNELVQEYARASYAKQMGDSSLGKHHTERASQTIRSWISSVKSYRHKACFRERVQEVSTEYFPTLLENVVSSIYPFRPETFHRSAPAYRARTGKLGAEIGLGLTSKVRGEYTDIVSSLKKQGIWDNPNTFFASNTSHSVSRMKIAMDELFEKDGVLKISEFWDILQAPPFGLFESSMAMVLMGLLMRQFSSAYYKYDGVTSTPLGPSDLMEMIVSSVKDQKSISRLEIRRMSKADEKLCAVVGDLLGCDLEKVKYPKLAQGKLRRVLSDIGYPAWSLSYSPDVTTSGSESGRLLKLISSLDRFSRFTGELSGSAYQELVESLLVNGGYASYVKPFVAKGYLAEGLKAFLNSIDPEITAHINKLKLRMDNVRAIIASLKNEEPWLWSEQSIEDRVPDLISHLRFISALSLLNGEVRPSVESSLVLLSKQFLENNLPDVLLTESGIFDLKLTITTLIRLARAPRESVHLTSEDRNRLSEVISERAALLRKHLMDTTGVIVQFAKEHIGHEMSIDEAHTVDTKLRRLPSDASPERIKEIIALEMEAVAKEKLVAELSSIWDNFTNSKSPSEWSSRNGVPIQWALGNSRCLRALQVINSPADRKLLEIQDALSLLKDCKKDFEKIRDTSYIRRCLYTAAVEPYYHLPKIIPEIHELSKLLKIRVTSNVYSWPHKSAEIREVVKMWITDKYKRELDLIRQQVSSLDEDMLRDVLDELLSDPGVGLTTFTIVSTKLVTLASS
jgi:hypothetical protein